MESSNSVDLQVLLGLLRQINTQQVHQVEAALNQFQSKNRNTHIIVKDILAQDSVEDEAKYAAMIILNSFLKSSLTDMTKNELFDFISSFLINTRIKDVFKRMIDKFLIDFINTYSEGKITQKLYQKDSLCLNFVGLSKQLVVNNNLDPALLIMAAYAVAVESHTQSFLYFIKSVFEMIAAKLLERVDISGSSDLCEWAKAMIQVLDRLTVLRVHGNAEATDVTNAICSSPDLFQITLQVYSLGAEGTTYICTAQGLNELNMLKQQFAEPKYQCKCDLVHHKCFEYVFKSKNKFPKAYESASRCFPFFYNTLCVLAKNRSLIEVYECEDLAFWMIRIILRMLKTAQFYHVFTNYANSILQDILLPFMETDQTERLLFDQSPQDFTSLAEDTCHKHEFNCIKTETAALLETVADYIDGSLTYIVKICLDSLKVRFGLLDAPTLPQGTVVLQAEVAFLILTVVSESISSRDDLLQEIAQLMASSDVILKSVNPLQFCRLCLFLSYNFTELFENRIEIGQVYIKHAFYYDGHQTTVIAALDLVSNQAENYYSELLLKLALEKSLTCNFGTLWDVLNSFTMKRIQDMSESAAIQVVQYMSTRAASDFKKFQSNQVSETVILIRCLQVIQNISSNKTYLQGKTQLIKRLYMPLEMLQFYKRIHFEDQLLKIFDDILDFKQCLQERDIVLLKILREIFDNNGRIFTGMLRTVNLFIKCSRETTESPLLATLAELCVDGLNPINAKASDEDIGEALLLLQIVLGKYGTIMSKNSVQVLYPMLVALFQSDKHRFVIKSRAANALFVLHLSHSIPADILLTLLKYAPKNFKLYERQVYVPTLSAMLFKESSAQILGIVLTNLVEALLLHKSELKMLIDEAEAKKEKKQAANNGQFKKYVPKKGKKTKYFLDYGKLLRKSTKVIESEWKSMDLFVVFKTALTKMKSSNEHVFQALLDSLDPQIVKDMREIANLVNVFNTARRIIKVSGIRSSEEVTALNRKSPPHGESMVGQAQSDEQEPMEDQEDPDNKKKRKLLKTKKKQAQ